MISFSITINTFSSTGIKTVAIVRKEDAVQMMKDLGATKLLVVGNIKSADEYSKKLLEATDGKKQYENYFNYIVKLIITYNI